VPQVHARSLGANLGSLWDRDFDSALKGRGFSRAVSSRKINAGFSR